MEDVGSLAVDVWALIEMAKDGKLNADTLKKFAALFSDAFKAIFKECNPLSL